MDLPNPEEIIKRRFKAQPLEKHPEVSLEVLLDKIFTKLTKKNPLKKISLRKLKKAIFLMQRELKLRYDPYVTFFTKKDKAFSNLGSIWKTPKGRLYLDSTIERIVVTSHVLLRFEERIKTKDKFIFDYIEKHYKANTLEFVYAIIATSELYFIQNDHVYLSNNIAFRINKNKASEPIMTFAILQKIESILVLKTFLTNRMWRKKKDRIPRREFKTIPVNLRNTPELPEFILNKFEE